ncbi:FmdB family zinc ribbon protein [Mycobacterium sherrisii]|uniref:FmdB family zinc ribbon protein n=1 Tax=Mycobacterium sherrisii TaxID=243061 RepID=UPI0021F2ADC4|nr:zinc ribbon domain-containing protein [Mycobacterium sherrisii]MEC4765400.1 zinc ribbon domain-containing protein [Mycobacterium sherrisii]
MPAALPPVFQGCLRRWALPTYGYKCGDCGPFTLVRPMAEARSLTDCPGCGDAARRVFGSPALHALDTGVRRAHDASERSAEAPQVVSSVPGRSRRATPITSDPRHARLPRP